MLYFGLLAFIGIILKADKRKLIKSHAKDMLNIYVYKCII